MSYRRSVNKAHFGPIIEWAGGKCPVAPGTPVSVMSRCEAGPNGQGYWRPVFNAERLEWAHTGSPRDILAYYERTAAPKPAPFGSAPTIAAQDCPTVAIPSSADHAHAMIAVASEWLARNEANPLKPQHTGRG